jgi:hypothetical protein
MTALKIKHSDDIWTPGCQTFSLKDTALAMNPNRFSQSNRNPFLFSSFHL